MDNPNQREEDVKKVCDVGRPLADSLDKVINRCSSCSGTLFNISKGIEKCGCCGATYDLKGICISCGR